MILSNLELFLEHSSLGLGYTELLRLGQHWLPLGVLILLVVDSRSIHGHIVIALATEMRYSHTVVILRL